jgi:hypothetical protein
LAQSFWSFAKVLIVDDITRVAKMLGFQPDPPPPTVEKILARHQELMRGGPPPTKDGPQKTPHPLLGDASKTMIPTQIPDKPNPPEGKRLGDGEEGSVIDRGRLRQTGIAFKLHFDRAMTAFKMKLVETWKPVRDYPPRGSIEVSGLVEIESPKAWMVYDVKASWDPKTKSYDPRSMSVRLRKLQRKNQYPGR